MRKKSAWISIATVAVIGCTLLIAADHDPNVPADRSKSYLIANVPHVRQKPDFCGEACVASWLNKLGVAANQDDVFNVSGLDPTLGRGCYTKELATSLDNLGFQTGPVWHKIPVTRKAEQLAEVWRSLRPIWPPECLP